MDRKQMIIEINKMIPILNKEKPQKTEFHSYLQVLDDAFYEDFKDVKKPEERPFFRYDEDTRLKEIERKEKMLSSNPECCLLEAVKYCQEKMRHFLEKYNIGFLKDFYLQESGIFFVEIACMISNMDSFHLETATKELKEQFQLDLLNSKGIQVHYNTEFNHNEISATTESIDAVLNLLKEELNARILAMKLRDYKGFRNLDKVSFYVDADILFEKDWKPIEIVLNKEEDTLNANEIGQFYHCLNELNSAASYMEFNKETSVSLMKSLFTEICSLANFEGKIFHEVDDERRPIREKNGLIHQKEANLGFMMKNVVKNAVKELSTKMKKSVYEKLNFDMRKFKVTPYQILVDFSFSTGPNWEKMKQLTDEELYEMYDTNHGTIDDEDILILCTERNQKTLESELTELYPSSIITTLEVQNHWSIKQNAIKGFTLSLDKV